jgi:hypothetical protein
MSLGSLQILQGLPTLRQRLGYLIRTLKSSMPLLTG